MMLPNRRLPILLFTECVVKRRQCGAMTDGELVAKKVINVTTLLGRWTSIDKDFEIEEGGTVKSAVKAESTPWTYWKIFNGRLVLNKDTFDVAGLGADSLYLENNRGIFVYKRNL